VDYSLNRGAAVKYPGFSVCVEKDDGQKYRREYALLGGVVRFAGEHPCELPPPVWTPKSGPAAPVAPQADTPPVQTSESFSHRLKERVKGWFKKTPKASAQ
jgi:hypothetical protein